MNMPHCLSVAPHLTHRLAGSLRLAEMTQPCMKFGGTPFSCKLSFDVSEVECC